MEPQGRGSAEEPGIVQRHAQGCVGPLRGLEDTNLPLLGPDWCATHSYISEARGR
jgi:hypothetical protein